MLANIEKTDNGRIEIAPEVVEIIAAIAASEIEGVDDTSGGFVGEIVEKLGRKNLTKGVKVTINQQEVKIDVQLVATYGFKLHEIANNVQQAILSSIESMTGLQTTEINIRIVDVKFKQEKEKKAELIEQPLRLQ